MGGRRYDVQPVAAEPGWQRLLLACTVVALLSGCAMSKPPYIADTAVLPSRDFAPPNPPQLAVRPATPEEAEAIMKFPGRESFERSAAADSAGSMLLAPALIVFFFPEFLNPDNWHFGQDPQVTEALAQFPSRLTKAVEERFAAVVPDESADRLDLVYYADVYTIGPAADTVCFVVHARLTLEHEGELLYQDTLRIDPRAFSDDIDAPPCTQAPEDIANCADEIIPAMIQSRLPGLPWKTAP